MMKSDLRLLVGKVITTGIPSPELDGPTRKALERLAPSGIILFRRNLTDVDQLCHLTAELQDLPSRPLVSIDHEGGSVMRLGPPFTQFPPASWIGRTGKPELAYAVGKAMGAELASVGIDVNFAPVLDVNSHPRNPIIGERAFGSNPHEVSTMAMAFMRGVSSAGILPCGKHFPGHGHTDRDSHTELPVVTRSRAELEATELPPFRAAIAAGVPMLMTAHVLFRDLDDTQPATLSRVILENLLRKELGFQGVIVSDDLKMRALSGMQSVPEAALASLRAGVDWLMVCSDLELSIAVQHRILRAIETRELDEHRLADAADRIRRLKQPSPRQSAKPPPIPEHEALNRHIRELANRGSG